MRHARSTNSVASLRCDRVEDSRFVPAHVPLTSRFQPDWHGAPSNPPAPLRSTSTLMLFRIQPSFTSLGPRDCGDSRRRMRSHHAFRVDRVVDRLEAVSRVADVVLPRATCHVVGGGAAAERSRARVAGADRVIDVSFGPSPPATLPSAAPISAPPPAALRHGLPTRGCCRQGGTCAGTRHRTLVRRDVVRTSYS